MARKLLRRKQAPEPEDNQDQEAAAAEPAPESAPWPQLIMTDPGLIMKPVAWPFIVGIHLYR
mgnify:CR=1 FL=1